MADLLGLGAGGVHGFFGFPIGNFAARLATSGVGDTDVDALASDVLYSRTGEGDADILDGGLRGVLRVSASTRSCSTESTFTNNSNVRCLS